MKTLSVSLGGDTLPVFYSDSPGEFEYWLGNQGPVTVDTETTGLDIYRTDYRLRLLQVGTETEAFVIPMEHAHPAFRSQIGGWLKEHSESYPLTFHNATFDRLVMDSQGVLRLEDLPPTSWHDTRTLSHLIDPRPKSEGGYGHGLKDLSDLFVDPHASGEGQDVLKAVFKANKWTKDTGWALIPIDHPDYVRYGGLDAILTSRLFPHLMTQVKNRDLLRLYAFEREVAELCARMERRGLLVDADYVEDALLPWLEEVEAEGLKEAREWGVENVNSTAQVAAALKALGWEPQEFTPSQKPKVDKAVLTALADDGNPVARSVQKGKRAGKWMTTYALPLLEDADGAGRIHPKINALQARTARMSVARPPLQQLPSGDWRIRRAIVADPGKVLWAADYDQVEMRVLAAMADEKAMKEAIANGVDLHDFTARMVWGDDFTPAHRKLGKGVGFGKVYGGGAKVIARQTGAAIEDVKRATAAYDSTFPGIKRFQKKLEGRATVGKREVVTASGRPLPLDGDRLYAATNYAVQSTSRDVLAQAMLLLEEAGVLAGEDILLPIHDELLGQSTPDAFEEVSVAIREAMTMDFHGVRLDAAAEIYGPSWGHGYGAPS